MSRIFLLFVFFNNRIGVDAQSDCSCWCLDKVYIKVPIYNSKVTFEADRWIGTHGLQPCTTEVDLYPSGTGKMINWHSIPPFSDTFDPSFDSKHMQNIFLFISTLILSPSLMHAFILIIIKN